MLLALRLVVVAMALALLAAKAADPAGIRPGPPPDPVSRVVLMAGVGPGAGLAAWEKKPGPPPDPLGGDRCG